MFPRDPNAPDNERPLRSIHDRIVNPWGIAPMFGPVVTDGGVLDSLGNIVQDGGLRLSPADPFELERAEAGL